MKYRKLRIAWSVLYGIGCVLLIVLWVRSYWWVDEAFVSVNVNWALEAYTIPGGCGAGILTRSSSDGFPGWYYDCSTFDQWQSLFGGLHSSRVWGHFFAEGKQVAAPSWFLISGAALLGVLPWMRQLKWRFSLRTLLIATTLIAVVLGVVVWLIR